MMDEKLLPVLEEVTRKDPVDQELTRGEVQVR
jgi:hypothetical protein